MKQAAVKCITFFRYYHSLLAWCACAIIVLMTFFQRYLVGDLWILVLFAGCIAEFHIVIKKKQYLKFTNKLKIFVTIALVCSVIFTFFNFFFSLTETGGSFPEIVDGTYAMVNYDGKGTEFITEREYHHYKCVLQRFWSGHALSFYTFSMFAHCEGKRENATEC